MSLYIISTRNNTGPSDWEILDHGYTSLDKAKIGVEDELAERNETFAPNLVWDARPNGRDWVADDGDGRVWRITGVIIIA